MPHRGHLRLVHAVVHVQPGTSCTTRWQVPPEGPWTDGHFPGQPVLPGVALVEAMAQAAVLAWASGQPAVSADLPGLAGVERARFRAVVRPGDVLEPRASVLSHRRGVWRFEAEVHRVVGEERVLVASATLIATALPSAR